MEQNNKPENLNARLDILNEGILSFSRMNGKIPDGVILHPVDFGEIEKEFLIPRVDKNDVKILGLKIYRSLDQEEGKFKLL